MTQIIINVRDSQKAKMLFAMLSALDFVNSVKQNHENPSPDNSQSENDFFDIAGIWEKRDISLANIRNQAWPRKTG